MKSNRIYTLALLCFIPLMTLPVQDNLATAPVKPQPKPVISKEDSLLWLMEHNNQLIEQNNESLEQLTLQGQ